jgi:hypothetical protein
MKTESRTVAQATDECRKAWKDNPSQYGWCIHHEIEFEGLSEPIKNRIGYILSNKTKDEQITRLDNMRPVSTASLKIVLPTWKAYNEAMASARKAYNEAVVPAWKVYYEAVVPARKAYNEAIASAHRADVPNHTWNGKSIFEGEQ